MQTRQRKTLESARRVQAFFDDHARATDAAVPFTLRSRFDAAVEELAAHQLEQELARAMARCETANHNALRHDMYYRLIVPIGRVANIVLRAAPEFGGLVMPATSLRNGHFRRDAIKLIASADVHVGVFVAHGMPDDFIDQLHMALMQLAESAEARDRHRSRQVEATYCLCEASRAVRRLVALIDSMMVPKIKRDQKMLATWISSRLISASSGIGTCRTPKRVPKAQT